MCAVPLGECVTAGMLAVEVELLLCEALEKPATWAHHLPQVAEDCVKMRLFQQKFGGSKRLGKQLERFIDFAKGIVSPEKKRGFFAGSLTSRRVAREATRLRSIMRRDLRRRLGCESVDLFEFGNDISRINKTPRQTIINPSDLINSI